MHRPQEPGGAADPVGQRRAIEIDALPGVDLGLAIERQVIGVFGDQHLGDRRLGRQAALDQPRRRGRLHDNVLASPAGIFGPAHDEHAELRRHDVEPLAHVLADPVQAFRQHGQAWSSMSTTISMRGRCAGSAPRFVRRLAARAARSAGARLSALGLAGRRDLLGLFQAEQQLVFRQRLGPAAEAVALQLLDDLAQPLVLAPLGQQHRLQRAGIVGKRVAGIAWPNQIIFAGSLRRSRSAPDSLRRRLN